MRTGETHYAAFVSCLHSYLLHMFAAISNARETYVRQAKAVGELKDTVSISSSLTYAQADTAVYPDLQILPQETFLALPLGPTRIGASNGSSEAMSRTSDLSIVKAMLKVMPQKRDLGCGAVCFLNQNNNLEKLNGTASPVCIK